MKHANDFGCRNKFFRQLISTYIYIYIDRQIDRQIDREIEIKIGMIVSGQYISGNNKKLQRYMISYFNTAKKHIYFGNSSNESLVIMIKLKAMLQRFHCYQKCGPYNGLNRFLLCKSS